MAFVNERLTPQQRIDFMNRGIKKPTSDNIACPIYGTFNPEKNMSLWHLDNLGRDDFNNHAFLFEWNGNEFFIIMEYFDPDPNSNLVKWYISKYENNFTGNEDFADDFKDALIAYGIDGSPSQRPNETIVDVVFKRHRDIPKI